MKVHGFRREKFLARRVTIRMACFFFNPCHTTLFSAPSRRENLSLYPLVDTDPANSATSTTATTTTDIPASLPLSVPFIPLNIIPRTSTCIPFQSRQEKRRVRLTRRFECLPRLSLASSGRGSLIYLDRESPPEGRWLLCVYVSLSPPADRRWNRIRWKFFIIFSHRVHYRRTNLIVEIIVECLWSFEWVYPSQFYIYIYIIPENLSDSIVAEEIRSER